MSGGYQGLLGFVDSNGDCPGCSRLSLFSVVVRVVHGCQRLFGLSEFVKVVDGCFGCLCYFSELVYEERGCFCGVIVCGCMTPTSLFELSFSPPIDLLPLLGLQCWISIGRGRVTGAGEGFCMGLCGELQTVK